MNHIFITTICLIILTGCTGMYSQFSHHPSDAAAYSFDGEQRNFSISDLPENEDVGSEELVSFEQ